jgi:hypothetical protein
MDPVAHICHLSPPEQTPPDVAAHPRPRKSTNNEAALLYPLVADALHHPPHALPHLPLKLNNNNPTQQTALT